MTDLLVTQQDFQCGYTFVHINVFLTEYLRGNKTEQNYINPEQITLHVINGWIGEWLWGNNRTRH